MFVFSSVTSNDRTKFLAKVVTLNVLEFSIDPLQPCLCSQVDVQHMYMIVDICMKLNGLYVLVLKQNSTKIQPVTNETKKKKNLDFNNDLFTSTMYLWAGWLEIVKITDIHVY